MRICRTNWLVQLVSAFRAWETGAPESSEKSWCVYAAARRMAEPSGRRLLAMVFKEMDAARTRLQSRSEARVQQRRVCEALRPLESREPSEDGRRGGVCEASTAALGESGRRAPRGSEVGPSTWSLLPKSSARSGVRQRILRHRRYPFAGALLTIAHGQAEDRLSLDAPLVAAALRDDPAFNLHVPTWGVGSFQAGRPPPTLGPAPVLVSVSKRGFSQLAARPPKARNPRLAVYARSSRS